MPGPKTHDVFYKDLKQHLSSNTLSSFPHYDDYRLFAQGHDFLIYHDFYKIWSTKQLNQNIQDSVLLQESKFPEFVYHYLDVANRSGAIEDEQTRLFLGPGYVMHHMLDAYMHPQIIYYAGDHARDPKKPTWQHGIIENLLDIYMMEIKEGIDPKTYPVYQDFVMNYEMTPELLQTLTDALYLTYQMEDGGERFARACSQLALFMKVMKYDPHGYKKMLFDRLDPLLKGTSSFSYHRDSKDALKYLNLNHEVWLNPIDDQVVSTDSALDLYEKALERGGKMVDELNQMCQSGHINYSDVCQIIPDISSVHGLDSSKKLVIRYTKNR